MDDIIVPELQNVDTTLIIDPDTRTIDAGSDFLLGVETDNDAERVKFQCPKIVGDNLDLSQYHIYIHYQNAKGEKGKYLCEDIEDGGENITFSWLLSQKAVLYKGQTKFLVCAKKTQEDTIVWNTTLANGNVLEGLDVDEDIVQQNDDVIEQILLKLEQIEASGGIDEETLNQINRNTEDISKLSDEIDDLKENGLNQNIDEAVANYLSENPISGGLTSTAKNLLITILRNSLYSNNQSENITALETALGQSSSDTTVYYSITNTLTNVTNNNSNTQVLENTSYIASLSANNGYTLESITVTMGGIDITSSVYADGVITIERISGNVEIIANAVEGSTEVVDSLPTDGLLGYWDMRNMTEPEVKDWHWAYPSNEGDGGLYASVTGGSKGTQSLPTYNEYGTTSSFCIMRDSASYPANVEFGTEFTFIILTHGGIPGTTANYNNGISPSNISPNWKFTVDYYKTNGSNIRISELGSGNNDDVTDYNFLVKRVNNENLKIVLDTSECDLTGTDYEDFSYWNQYVQPSPYMTTSIVAFALYGRALTDVEIEDARGFFKTLEVA